MDRRTVRMALHTGTVEVRGGDYLGLPLSRIARLLSAAHGGQILLSRATWELSHDQLSPEVALRDLGTHRLADLTHPEQIFQLVAPDLMADFPPLRTLSAYPTNLPTQPTALLGRAHEVAIVRDLLRRADVRLVTLTGPGGVGKTRLALQVAAELLDNDQVLPIPARSARGSEGVGSFPNGIYFVNLATIADPNLVATAIAQALEVREAAGQPLLETLKAYLRDKRLLLLLDNFEQVLEAAPVVAACLTAAPGLKVLITSRAVLHLAGEQEYPVPPLELPPTSARSFAGGEEGRVWEALTQYAAVALFLQRALTVKPDFAITNVNAPAVAEICARLDGLPLALELAAARVKLFPPEALLKRLEHRFSVLTGGPRDLPARQQTLRNTIDWSYHLLVPETQTLFRRLAVFVGGCTLHAAEAVCQVEPSTLKVGPGTGESATIKLQPSNLSAFDGLAVLIDQSLVRQVEGLDGEPRFIMLETIREYALECLEQSGEAEALQRLHAEYYLAFAEAAEPEVSGVEQRAWLERLEAEHDNFRAALAWALSGGSAEVMARLATALHEFWIWRGYRSEGQQWLEAVVERSSALPAAARAEALATAGVLAWSQGDDVRATALYEQSLALARELGDQNRIAWALYNLGEIAYYQHAHAQATTLLEESLADFRAQDDQRGITAAIKRLGTVALEQRDFPRAAALLQECLARSRELGDQGHVADVLHILAMSARLQGDDARALTLEQESLALCRELGFKHLLPAVLVGLGYIAQHQGDPAQARRCFTEGLTLGREMGNQRAYPLCLAGLAGVASMMGQPARAARLFGAVEALGEASSHPLVGHQIELERNVALARAQLDTATFAAAWAAGRAMTTEQAISEALKGDG